MKARKFSLNYIKLVLKARKQLTKREFSIKMMDNQRVLQVRLKRTKEKLI